MINSPPSLLYALLMLVAGLGIPIMAALNAGLGQKLQSPALATVILFVIGTLLSVVYLLVNEGIPKLDAQVKVPAYFYMAGAFVIFYILSITWVVPKFGVGNAISFVLLGQLISMASIDHYALLGTVCQPISWQRLAGLALMALGAAIALPRL